MMSKLVLCLALATAVRANDFEVSEEYVYGEPRLLDGVFNNTSIDLNSILALVLIAILALVTIGPNFLGGGGTGYGYNRNGYEQYNDYYDYNNQQQFYKRAGQFDSDVAGKMAQLEQAFKKYQVEEAECEMYISCEASQVHRIEENGPLARIVHDILSTFNRAKDGHKWDSRIEGLVQAFEYGTGARQAGSEDPCQPLRNKCFELHAKKSY